MVKLEVSSGKPEHGNTEFLHTHTFPNGKPFPRSYQDFVTAYGYGLSLGLFLIYIPLNDYGDSWNVRSEEIQGTYIDDLEEEEEPWFDLEPDGSIELMKRVVPFAASENGHYLFWDIENGKDGEFDIYITDFRGMGIIKAAGDLNEFIEKATDAGRFKEVLPFAEKPLQRTFKPLAVKG